MAKKGLLIDYEYCTGCYSCIVACKQEHNYPVGKGGIRVDEIITEGNGKVRTDYIPFPTEYCDLCASLVAKGEKPACVKHCMAKCMSFGPLNELANEMENLKRSVLFSPRSAAKIPLDL
jgi:Fe-S-cluster-containing dehydrogenase component